MAVMKNSFFLGLDWEGLRGMTIVPPYIPPPPPEISKIDTNQIVLGPTVAPRASSKVPLDSAPKDTRPSGVPTGRSRSLSPSIYAYKSLLESNQKEETKSALYIDDTAIRSALNDSADSVEMDKSFFDHVDLFADF
jgi:hypothetical protein